MNILLIRFSSLGDVVLQTATVQWLKSRFQDKVNVYFLTSKEFAPMLEGHPLIKEVIVFDRRSGETVRSLARKIKQNYKIDLLLDMHATTRSTLLRLFLFTIPRLVIDKRRWERLLLQIPFFPKKWWKWKIFDLSPQVKRIQDDFSSLLHAPVLTQTPFTFTPPHQKAVHPREYIVLAPVASFGSKHWPIESYVELAEIILKESNYDVVVVAGPSDTHCEAFQKISNDRLINLQGKTKLLESAGWLKGARMVIGNDSGMNHIAEANGVKVLTLFGPTHEAFGFAPHLEGSKTMSLDLWCRPCSATGKRDCYRSEKFCLTGITSRDVWSQVQGML